MTAPVMSLTEFARILGVEPARLRRTLEARDGRLNDQIQALPLADRWVFSRRAVEAWLAGPELAPPTPIEGRRGNREEVRRLLAL